MHIRNTARPKLYRSLPVVTSIEMAAATRSIRKYRKMVTLLPIFSPFSGLSMSMTPVLVNTSPTVLTGTGAPKPGRQRRT